MWGPQVPGVVEVEPAAGLGPRLEVRVDDPPGLLDLVGADEQGRVAAHRIEQQPGVAIHARVVDGLLVAEVHRHRLDPEGLAGDLGPEVQRDPLVGLDPQHQHVRAAGPATACPRRPGTGPRGTGSAISVTRAGRRLPVRT